MKISQFLKKLVYCHFLRDTWINNENIKKIEEILEKILCSLFLYLNLKNTLKKYSELKINVIEVFFFNVLFFHY